MLQIMKRYVGMKALPSLKPHALCTTNKRFCRMVITDVVQRNKATPISAYYFIFKNGCYVSPETFLRQQLSVSILPIFAKGSSLSIVFNYAENVCLILAPFQRQRRHLLFWLYFGYIACVFVCGNITDLQNYSK